MAILNRPTIEQDSYLDQLGHTPIHFTTGMSFGAVRHVADIRADDCTKEGSSVIGLQMGSNKFASQSGMTFGGVRHVGEF